MSSTKQQVVVMIDNELMDFVDAWGGDRSQTIEEALYLWCQQKGDIMPYDDGAQPQEPEPTPPRPMSPAEYHRQRHNDDETGWLV